MGLAAALSNKLRCWRFYFFACYRGTGGRIKYVSEDWSEIQMELPLNWRTRNYVGTIFGGSIYGAIDPIYVLMLIKRLGPEFVIWDRVATIQFKKPGRETLQAKFAVDDDEVQAIRSVLETRRFMDRKYTVNLVDPSGAVCATIEKVVFVRRR